MKIYRIRSYDEFAAHALRNKNSIDAHTIYLDQVTPPGSSEFTVSGYSYPAGKQVEFLVDFQHSGDGNRVNWRERVCCPKTYFNNRMRATFHLFDIEMEPYPDSKLYITEQITPIYTYFAEKFPNTIGSEFLGEQLPFGTANIDGIRNETLCDLSFPDQSFDMVISLDVLEHIPEYSKAFKECARVLKNGGRLMWSAPFVPSSQENLLRAIIRDNEIIHIESPEYHGDPLSGDGVLCFQHFGWEMLDQVRSAGFSDAYALCYCSTEFGYLGGDQFMFIAIK
ncbi:class I SAM-dependent methyltransferase [Polynucleobacter sp. AP-Sanab-80-C2]|uniref:class I SAM-dependent methyltransferase n=1 Tax=Polynucleobacter sp. AP-Sanab-80-C2 TaxID=3108274 RepID=UPI002B239E0F|nr:class I SAM-dependent methyltransferase [Polynucleobacter sp. AP-Sanab-80-C2]MEA9598530.1 class I SAM-dependent methyltransferase [Polynucleobacter sp. AP-Sanab-80-C2]